MSTELIALTGEKEFSTQAKKLYLVRFFGGKRRGLCIQLSLENDYIQLNKDEVKKLIHALEQAIK